MKYINKFFSKKFIRYLNEDIYSDNSMGEYGARVKQDVYNSNRNGSQNLSKILNKEASVDKAYRLAAERLDPEAKQEKESRNLSNKLRRRFEFEKSARTKRRDPYRKRAGTLSTTTQKLQLEGILYIEGVAFSEYIREEKGKDLLKALLKEKSNSKYTGSLYNYIKDNIELINKKLEEDYYNAS